MTDMKWLKDAPVSATIAAVKSYGSLALVHNGLTDMQNADLAARAIGELDNARINAQAFFMSMEGLDNLRTIEYGIKDYNADFNFVLLTKTTTYKFKNSSIDIEEGPMVPREVAQDIVNAMNKLQGIGLSTKKKRIPKKEETVYHPEDGEFIITTVVESDNVVVFQTKNDLTAFTTAQRSIQDLTWDETHKRWTYN